VVSSRLVHVCDAGLYVHNVFLRHVCMRMCLFRIHKHLKTWCPCCTHARTRGRGPVSQACQGSTFCSRPFVARGMTRPWTQSCESPRLEVPSMHPTNPERPCSWACSRSQRPCRFGTPVFTSKFECACQVGFEKTLSLLPFRLCQVGFEKTLSLLLFRLCQVGFEKTLSLLPFRL